MKKRTSKQIFAETFLELSRELPIGKITVKKIVEESGLSLKTFYNHFSDKYSLMLYIEQMTRDEACVVMRKSKKQMYNLAERGRVALRDQLKRMGFSNEWFG